MMWRGAMKRLNLVSFLLALAMTSIFLREAHAIDPPHEFACTTCHTTHLVLGSTGYDNICLTCHRPGVPRGGSYPFIPADAANPFGTYSGPQPAVRYQTSHKWFGSDEVPQAG